MSSSKKFNTGYIKQLKGPDLTRYKALVDLCAGVDPYEVELNDTSSDMDLIPDINIAHITQYLVHTTQTVTMKQMCAYKGTEAHNFVMSGFVQCLLFHKLQNGKLVVLGKVKHSQTLSVSTKPLLPWVLLEVNGDVLCGWCTCKAGCGEVCSHVSAILYALEIGASKKSSLACTSKANAWLPPPLREVTPSEVCKIDFVSSHMKRKRVLDGTDVDELAVNLVSSTDINISQDRLDAFFSDLHDNGVNCAIFRVLPQYRDEFTPKIDCNLPPKLLDLFDPAFVDLSLQDIRARIGSLYSSCKISLEQRTYIEKHTRKQSKCHLWKVVKAGRLSGSTMYDALHTKLDNPAITTVKRICYPFQIKVKTFWTDRGLKLEDMVRQLYLKKLEEDGHVNVLWKETGFYIPLEAPHMGASPDGCVKCDCCGVGLIELKVMKNPLPDPDFVPSGHMYQIQTQLFCVGPEAKYSDYVVYVGDDKGNGKLTVKRVYPDHDLQDVILDQSKTFFLRVVLVELVSRYFSSLKSKLSILMPSHQANIANDCVCHCRRPRQDPMIKCIGKNCDFQWYHLRCMQLKQARKNWLCPLCQSKQS